MSTDIDKIKKLLEEERKKLEKVKLLVNEEIVKAMGSSPTIEDQNNAVKAVDNANKQAYGVYQKIDELNKAKSNEAEKQYRDTCAENNEKVKNGKMTPEERNKANEEAFDAYVRTKKENDKATDKAYEEYQAFFNENSTKLKSLQEHYQKHNPSPPPLTVTAKSENVNPLVSAFKEHFKNDEWYKNNEPKIEGNTTSLTFKSDEDAFNFAKKLASENQNFIMIDKETNKVLAYSKDGKLFRGDKELTEGPLRPSKEEMEKLPTLDKFQKPQTPTSTTEDKPPELTSPKSTDLTSPKSSGVEIPDIPVAEKPQVEPPKDGLKEKEQEQHGLN
ncbi:TPA: hypothetical protein ACTXXA_002026 [Legionella anisa]